MTRIKSSTVLKKAKASTKQKSALLKNKGKVAEEEPTRTSPKYKDFNEFLRMIAKDNEGTTDLKQASKLDPEVIASLELIQNIEPDFYEGLRHLIVHISNTYGDKYSASPMQTKEILYHPTLGLGANAHSIHKYLSRYLTEGFNKSKNSIDLLKIAHFCLFEFKRIRSLAENGKVMSPINQTNNG